MEVLGRVGLRFAIAAVIWAMIAVDGVRAAHWRSYTDSRTNSNGSERLGFRLQIAFFQARAFGNKLHNSQIVPVAKKKHFVRARFVT